MTNEELRTKIVEILEETECEWTEEKNGYILQIFYDKLADALIAAGLTFEPMTFRIVENKPYSYTAGELANWKEDQDRIAKLLHRAEVAERALDKVFTDTFPWCCAKIREDIVQECLQEAEKELQEEGKE